MATHLAAQVCCALYWFNPMVWIAARALRRERERACDDRVLTAGTSATDYATELLDIARAVVGSEGHAASLAMARRSQLEGRLLSILDPRVRRGIPGRTSAAVLAVSALVLAIPLAAFQPAAVRASAPPTAVLRAVSRLGERAAPVDSHQAVSAVSQGDPVAVRDPEAITAGHDAPVQQRVPIRALSAPTARSREPVANIIELRELPGQKVLVNLPFQARLFLLYSALASYKVLMDTTGSGAMRYPNAAESIIRFVGDSTLFGDPESRSFVVVSPTGELGRAVAAPNGRDFVSIAAWQAGGRPGTDAQGRIVYQAQAPRSYESANPLPGPLYAAVVIRADFATRSVDTIAHIVNLGARRYANRGTRDVSTVINPLQQAIDDWAVLSDGSIAIVRGHDYHIDWVYPDGTRASTPAMPFDWRRVTEDEKKAKLDSARRMIDSLRAANADPFQIVTFSATRTDTTHPRLDYVTPAEMADYVPPIRWGTVKPDVDGNLWILPSTSLDAKGGLLYDVVNKKGELFQRVQLPPGRNIAGFGRGGVVYMVAKAENGQWYLERSKVIR